MRTLVYKAATARSVLRKIRQAVGAEATVVSARRIPRGGFWGLLGFSQLEVVVEVPGEPVVVPKMGERIFDDRNRLPESPPMEHVIGMAEKPRPKAERVTGSVEELLIRCWEEMEMDGLQQRALREVLDSEQPGWLDGSIESGLRAFAGILADQWQNVGASDYAGENHLVIGPAGVGKSQLLGCWVMREHLASPGGSSVVELDGSRPNTCPNLRLLCEAMGIRVDRNLQELLHDERRSIYLDAPGVNWVDASEVAGWRDRLAELRHPKVHLVLNAAYSLVQLRKQLRAFAPLNFVDVSFTHVDEEPNLSKLWSLIIGNSCRIRWLAGGQRFPGRLKNASWNSLLPPSMRPFSGDF